MKRLLLVFLTLICVICVSCAKEGTYVPSENAKADFKIEFLFECDGVNFKIEFLFGCDGVKIYRFYDKGRAKYFTTGNGRMTDSTYRQGSSKSSVTVDDTVIQ